MIRVPTPASFRCVWLANGAYLQAIDMENEIHFYVTQFHLDCFCPKVTSYNKLLSGYIQTHLSLGTK